ncbi:MAG: cytochrome c biogenesis protein CcsA [Gemmatimonadota bacterium]
MILGSHLAALLCYLAAWVTHLEFFRRGRSSPDGRAVGATSAGFVFHLAGLVAFALHERALPLVGVGPASSTLALAVVAFTLGAAVRPDTRASGLFLLPLAVALLAEAILVGLHPAPRQLAFRGPWLVLHVTTVFAGFAGLALASAASAMYVLQFRTLKRKEFGSVFRFFPSLDALDRLGGLGLGIGFPALSVGLLAGWGWTLTYGPTLPPDDPQVVLAVVAWGSYLAAIGARLSPRWRGPRAALVSAAAFVATALAFVVLRLLADGTGDSFL